MNDSRLPQKLEKQEKKEYSKVMLHFFVQNNICFETSYDIISNMQAYFLGNICDYKGHYYNWLSIKQPFKVIYVSSFLQTTYNRFLHQSKLCLFMCTRAIPEQLKYIFYILLIRICALRQIAIPLLAYIPASWGAHTVRAYYSDK